MYGWMLPPHTTYSTHYAHRTIHHKPYTIYRIHARLCSWVRRKNTTPRASAATTSLSVLWGRRL
ncbi:hypothetical protein EON63_08905 [archaeon]|nr:MAG: hypothetical protein EON63_08905 [archaeon]